VGDPLRSPGPYLFVERNLGVPRKILFKAYLIACSVFASSRKKYKLQEVEQRHSAVADLVTASSVILLANPAHQTALNMRKRLIQDSFLDPEKELEIVGAFQSARECAKEAILWDHRRWLLRILYSQAPGRPSYDEHSAHCRPHSDLLYIPHNAFQKEFSLIGRSCEIYPRNYYAWTHWGFCINSLCARLRANSTASDDRQQLADVLVQEVLRLRRWVELHVSDHSAVHHLCRLLQEFQYHPISNTSFSSSATMNPALSFEHALSLVNAYPSHESLWLYLRATVCIPEDQKNKKILKLISSLDLQCQVPVQLACRSLAWWAHQVWTFLHDC
jgi:protein prenyltransferase alpha subunit repeat containing protein 1